MTCTFPVGRVNRDYDPVISLVNRATGAPISLAGTIEVRLYAPGQTASPLIAATMANGKISAIDAAGGALNLALTAADLAAMDVGYGTVEVVRTSTGADTLASYTMQWIAPGVAAQVGVENVALQCGSVTVGVSYVVDADALSAHAGSTDNPHSVTKAQVGLGNADNTSDADKPVSTATATALAAKAPLASPALTGTPTAPTATAGTNTTQVATTAFVKKAVDDLVAAAPGALDTLDELSAALADDPNFATTMTNALAGKENSGAAASAVSAHVSAPDPHSQYLTETDAAATYATAAALSAHAGNVGTLMAAFGQAWEELQKVMDGQDDDALTSVHVLNLAQILGQLSDQVNGGRVTLAGGTLADPALRIGTVGIYSAAANTLSFAISGVERLRVTASGITVYGTVTNA